MYEIAPDSWEREKVHDKLGHFQEIMVLADFGK